MKSCAYHFELKSNSTTVSKKTPTKKYVKSVSPQQVEPVAYGAFRETFYDDSTKQVHQSKAAQNTTMLNLEQESYKNWHTTAENTFKRTQRFASETENSRGALYAPSLDRMYNSDTQTMGYKAYYSLRGSSMCDKSERFILKTATPSDVGPGSYSLEKSAITKERKGQVHFTTRSHSRKKLHQPCLIDSQDIESTKPDENNNSWKSTSTKTEHRSYSFDKSKRTTWVCEKPIVKPVITQHHRLPNFVEGSSAKLQKKVL